MKSLMSFEKETCTRCHGTGNYSYCHDYGSKCFKCAGRKVTYSKRGLAAKEFFENLIEVPVTTLNPGDLIEVSSVTFSGKVFNYIACVEETPKMIPSKGSCSTIDKDGERVLKSWEEQLEIKYSNPKFKTGRLICDPKMKIKLLNHPNKEELFQQALRYQESLTKAGKERKRKV